MMTSSNGNIFRVTGPLCGEFTGPGEFPTQRPVTRSFDVFFDLRLNKQLSKQPWGWWFETLSRPLWLHRNVTYISSYVDWWQVVTSIHADAYFFYDTPTLTYQMRPTWYWIMSHPRTFCYTEQIVEDYKRIFLQLANNIIKNIVDNDTIILKQRNCNALLLDDNYGSIFYSPYH